MFKNYLITAYKVLQRRKFFSFVNLFGIALTLAVLTLVVAMLDNYVNPRGAEANSANFLGISQLVLESEDRRSNWSDNPGYRFMQDYVLPMQTPTMISIHSTTVTSTSFVDGRKHVMALRRTDGNYWKILQFSFIEGVALTDQDNSEGRFVAVINRHTRDEVFGERQVTGEKITVNGQSFDIIGVVENEPELNDHAFADVWVPISTDPSSTYKSQMMGGFRALLLADPKVGREVIKQEYRQVLSSFEYEDPEQFAHAVGGADGKLDLIAREVTNSWKTHESGADKFIALLAGAMLLFMLLPTINLVNLNTSRILERASEIGVRKAFGASSWTLVGQFIVENLLLTALGGVVGFLLAWLLLDLVSASGLIKYAQLQLNLRVFAWSLLLIAVFGVLSGAYPAWRMSRMQPVQALKGA